MQTYFSAALQKIQQDLEDTATHHLAQQAQFVDEAKKALASATAASRRMKSGTQSEAVRIATEQLAALEKRQKTLDQTFAQYRDVLKKAASSL